MVFFYIKVLTTRSRVAENTKHLRINFQKTTLELGEICDYEIIIALKTKQFFNVRNNS